MSNEGVSLLENAAHLGLPVPVQLKRVLEQLHERAEGDDESAVAESVVKDADEVSGDDEGSDV
jgi:hypothetical protein